MILAPYGNVDKVWRDLRSSCWDSEIEVDENAERGVQEESRGSDYVGEKRNRVQGSSEWDGATLTERSEGTWEKMQKESLVLKRIFARKSSRNSVRNMVFLKKTRGHGTGSSAQMLFK